MEFKLCDNPWDEEELDAIQRVIDSNMYTMGSYVKEYEQLFAKKYGAKYAVMTSSGSTANLLAIASMVYSGKLKRGAEVIVPAVSWSTTYAPLEQFGLKLVFVDIDKHTLNISVDCFKKAVNENTKMVFLVNLLGNSNEFNDICKYCNERKIIIAEDNCESLGAKYNEKYLGTIGLFGTYSTFYSHHMCTMEGGIVVTNDDVLYEYMLAVRAHGWTRNLPNNSKIYQKKEDSFYESFNFIVPGFNLRPLEMEGAIGIEQLKKIDKMIEQRRKNAKYFIEKMKEFSDVRLQKEVGESSWFGFAIILENKLAGKRDIVISKLREANIEVRPIVAGNFTRNKAIEFMNYKIPFELSNADDIHFNGFFIGNHSKDNNNEIDYFVSVFKEAIREI